MIGNATVVHIHRWALAYSAAGHTVDILSIRADEVPGARVHTVSVGPANSTKRLWTLLSYVRLALSARRRVRRLEPDVVNPNFVTTSGTLARIAGVHPIVLTAWGSDVIPPNGVRSSWTTRVLNRWALAGADRITAQSQFLADWVKRAGSTDDVVVVPFGVDTRRFHPPQEPRPRERFTIGTMKALEVRYGFEFLIEAMPQVLDEVPHARLVIAGGGTEEGRLKDLVQSLGIHDEVTFLGRVRHDDIPGLLDRFDVLVNPTVVPEAFGVAVLEGSASGLPVVATDVGGVPGVCIDGATGFLVPPRDPSAFVEPLVALAADPDLRRAMGSTGRAHVVKSFEWSSNVDEMLDVLDPSPRPSQ